MLQIIVWLGCLYALLKGLGLLQTAVVAPERSSARAIGYFGFAAALLGAAFFFFVANQQAHSVSGLFSLTDPVFKSAAERAVERFTPEQRAQHDAIGRSDLESSADALEAAADNLTSSDIDNMTAADAQTGNAK